MAIKQKDYLAALPGNGAGMDAAGSVFGGAKPAPTPAPPAPERARGTTLLGCERALAPVASGEVRQVTQLLLDPGRARIWPGNARSYRHLDESSCRDLIDSIIAEGGQKVPAVVRRVEGDAGHDYEVIAGTRRHWSISWLRANNYPDMEFLAQVADLDDEAAFRLADLENRARQDVSDLERARNYAAALGAHYSGHQTRMAERLKLSQGWLSKMLKVAALPDQVIAAFSSPFEVQLKPAYPLAQAFADDQLRPRILRNAVAVASAQHNRRVTGHPPLEANEVIRQLLDKNDSRPRDAKPIVISDGGRPSLSVRSSNRQGTTIRLHAGHGLSRRALMQSFSELLDVLEENGTGIGR